MIDMQEMNIFSFEQMLVMNGLSKDGCLYDRCCFISTLCVNKIEIIMKRPFCVADYMIGICTKGHVEFKCNLENCRIDRNAFFIIKPGSLIKIESLEDSCLDVILFTKEFLGNLHLPMDGIMMPYKIQSGYYVVSQTHNNMDICKCFDCLKCAIQGNDTNPHYHEMVRSSMTAFLSKIAYEISESNESDKCISTSVSREIVHFNNFIGLLSMYCKEHRAVSFYAKLMCMSPKYLSLLVKSTSGKCVSRWIDEFVVREAKNLLKYSTKNIQEISNELHFPNQSFFSKYFKRYTGITPTDFRDSP